MPRVPKKGLEQKILHSKAERGQDQGPGSAIMLYYMLTLLHADP